MAEATELNDTPAVANQLEPVVRWTDKNREPLKVGEVYSIPCSKNKFELIAEFGLNNECFKRVHDNSLHYGREFLAIDDGEEFIDVYT